MDHKHYDYFHYFFSTIIEGKLPNLFLILHPNSSSVICRKSTLVGPSYLCFIVCPLQVFITFTGALKILAIQVSLVDLSRCNPLGAKDKVH